MNLDQGREVKMEESESTGFEGWTNRLDGEGSSEENGENKADS